MTGELWTSEHGPQRGDEINITEAGRNYGWPLVTCGRHQGIATHIGEEGPKAGFEPPLRHWVPTSAAPSRLAFLTSYRYAERHPNWKGSLFMGTLREQTLWRFRLDGRRITVEQKLLVGQDLRIRDARQGLDGYIYLPTEAPQGPILRLLP